MADTPIAASDGRDYPPDMEARLRVLEEIADNTKTLLGDIKADQRAMRAEMVDIDGHREADFRITFGAIITATLGLAFLIARAAHWL
jgi:hypothetical protein